MKKPNYHVVSTYLFYISLIIIVIAVASFTWTLATESNIYFDPTSKGWSDFIGNHKSLIAIAGVGLALFALWMTAERMRQTQEQIEAITENNRFNNYYQHKEKFFEYMFEKDIVKKITVDEKNRDTLLHQIYSFYYYSNYKKFSPKLNSEHGIIIEEAMNQGFEILIKKDPSHIDMSDDLIDDVVDLCEKLEPIHYYKSLREYTRLINIKSNREIIRGLIDIYYCLAVTYQVYSFQGFEDEDINVISKNIGGRLEKLLPEYYWEYT